jgi:hypothetical protein
MSGPHDRSAPDRVSRTLMYVGTGLAVVAVAAWTFDAMPAMPEWMLRLAIYKLTLASGAGLLIAGAVLRRSFGNRRPTPAAPQVGEGTTPPPIPRDGRHHAESRREDQ